MKKRNIILLLILAMSITLLSACGGDKKAEAPAPNTKETAKPSEAPKEPAKEKIIIARETGDPQSFHPSISADDNAYGIVQNLYSRLVKLDYDRNIIPDAAKSWDISADGMEIVFHLRDNIKWHDGEKFTADDVVYTFMTIKGNEAYFLNSNLKTVKDIVKVDDSTVKFIMNEPDVAIIAHLAWYGCFIVPKHIYDNGKPWEDNPANMNPIGSGPFKFGEYKAGVSTTLVKNKDYWEGEPKIDKVIYQIIPDATTAYQALINGEIDVLNEIPDADYEAAKANPAIRLSLDKSAQPLYIVFNYKEKVMQDEALRTAIAMIIDRESISKKVFRGIKPVETNMYPSVVKWATNSTDTAPAFNIEGAIKVLESAGYVKDKDGYYIKGLTIDVFDEMGCPDVAKLMQADAKKAGIEIIINSHEYNAWEKKVFDEKNFIIELQGGFQGPDPAALVTRVGTGGPINLGSYSNPKVDELLKQATKTGDQAKRAEIYREIQKIMAKELPLVPIVNYSAYDAVSSKIVNAPFDGVGKWGRQEYTFTDIK